MSTTQRTTKSGLPLGQLRTRRVKTVQTPKENSPKSSKETESVFELIDNLPKDLKGEVFQRLLSYKASNSNKLSEVSREFADIYSYSRRLHAIKTANEKASASASSRASTKTSASSRSSASSRARSSSSATLKNLLKTTDTVVKTVGDLPLKKIRKYTPVKDEIDQIFEWHNVDMDPIEDISYSLQNETLEEAKENYEEEFNKKDFEAKKNEWVEYWNFVNSNIHRARFPGESKDTYPDNLSFMQKKLAANMEDMINWDKENAVKNKEKIDKFLKLNDNITYEEYVKSIRGLPFAAKTCIGL